MLLILAAMPVLIPACLLLLLRQSAAVAGTAGLLVALAIATLAPPFHLPPAGLADALFRGGLTTLIVAYILLGGFLLYQVLREAGALETISNAVMRALPDPAHRLLTLVFGVSVFFESVTGFGIGVVVCAPLFLALGHPPLKAAFLALLGQCAVPWGALGIGTVLGSELSDVPLSAMGAYSVALGLPFVMLCGGVALYVAGEFKPWPRRLALLIAYTGVLSLALWAGSVWISVELAGCLAGLAVTLLGLASGARASRTTANARPGGLIRALLPVALLVVALLLTRLCHPLTDGLQTLAVLEVARFDFRLPMLYHPGFWMLASAMAGAIVFRLSRQQTAAILRGTLRHWTLATLAIAGFIGFAQVMVDAGMTGRLADAATGAVGDSYVLLVPWIGALGGFLTASNAGANAMFMQLHVAASQALNLPLEEMAAAQNAAAANATLASPGRVVLAAAVTGCLGQEHRLLRPALAVILVATAATTAVLAAGGQ